MLAALCTAAMLAGCGLLPKAADQTQAGPSGGPTPSPSPTTSTSPPPTSPSPTSPTLAGDGLGQYYEQPVQWTECQQVFECARILVPLDYDEPDGETIELAVIKRPADDPASRVGSLIVNPGGPGGSGVEYAQNATSVFGEPLLDHFDIVGFDPRGVGESTPIDCVGDEELDQFIAADPDPDTSAEADTALRLLRDFTAGCEESSGALLAHVSTPEAARDVDVLRALIGDEKINYYGASYGTFLGATYAELFPDRVGRMVLDGAIDPTLTPRESALGQAEGFQTALRAYVEDCVQQPDCPVGTDVEAGLERINDFFEQVDRQPISGDGERELTEGYAVVGVWLPLYVEDYWPLLSRALSAAFDGDGALLLQLADYYTDRGPSGFTGNVIEANYAVNCLDRPESASIAEIQRSIPAYERASSVFGSMAAWFSLGCSNWPVKADHPMPQIDAAGADPILVVGTTRDPATPYKGAIALANQLESGVLLSRDGDGHTAYMAGNPCIDETIEAYLVDGVVPPDGKQC